MNTRPKSNTTIARRPLRSLTRLAPFAVVVALIAGACGDSSGDDPSAADITSTSVEPVSTATPSTSVAPTTAAPTTAAPTTTAAPALVVDGDAVTIDWSALEAEPFYATPVAGGDPLFHIHTTPAVDGFFLSLEMYTTGYGQGWTGETGTFDISCDNPTSSTGICPYFDADGAGPEPVKGADFMTTGSLTIVQLDDGGYEIIVHELVFSDGTTFDEFTITG